MLSYILTTDWVLWYMRNESIFQGKNLDPKPCLAFINKLNNELVDVAAKGQEEPSLRNHLEEHGSPPIIVDLFAINLVLDWRKHKGRNNIKYFQVVARTPTGTI